MLKKKIGTSGIFVLLLSLPLAAHIVTAQEDTQGFIYGTVVTESGTEYQGFLRWGTQEAFWDDLFNSSKVELPFYDYLADDEYDELMAKKAKCKLTKHGDVARAENQWLVDEANKK